MLLGSKIEVEIRKAEFLLLGLYLFAILIYDKFKLDFFQPVTLPIPFISLYVAVLGRLVITEVTAPINAARLDIPRDKDFQASCPSGN